MTEPAITLPAAVRFEDARATLDAALARADARLAAAPGRPLAVDLSGTRDYDSSLVAVLLALARRAAAAGGGLRLDGAAPNLRKLAALYGVDELLFQPSRPAPTGPSATP